MSEAAAAAAAVHPVWKEHGRDPHASFGWCPRFPTGSCGPASQHLGQRGQRGAVDRAPQQRHARVGKAPVQLPHAFRDGRATTTRRRSKQGVRQLAIVRQSSVAAAHTPPSALNSSSVLTSTPPPPHPRLCRWWTGCGRRRRTTCRSPLLQRPPAAGGCWPTTPPWQGACCRWERVATGGDRTDPRTPSPPAKALCPLLVHRAVSDMRSRVDRGLSAARSRRSLQPRNH